MTLLFYLSQPTILHYKRILSVKYGDDFVLLLHICKYNINMCLRFNYDIWCWSCSHFISFHWPDLHTVYLRMFLPVVLAENTNSVLYKENILFFAMNKTKIIQVWDTFSYLYFGRVIKRTKEICSSFFFFLPLHISAIFFCLSV